MFFALAGVLMLAACGSRNNVGEWALVPLPVHESETYYNNGGYADHNGAYQIDEGTVSFRGSSNSDGYIPNGNITLYSIGGISKKFKQYYKGNKDYVKYGGLYYDISGLYVTIDNIKYKCK